MARIIEQKMLALDDMQPFPGNARRGNVAKIRESLRRNGQYRPVVVQKDTGYILAGNHTWQAAQAEGMEGLHATIVECDETEAKRIVLVDNKSNDEAGYDNLALAELLKSMDGDFEGSGFEAREFNRIMDQLAGTDGTADDPKRGVPIPANAKTQAGHIYKLGPHRLACGDSLSPATYAALMEDSSARLVVTSPPYNQDIDKFQSSGFVPSNSAFIDRMQQAYADSKPEAEYRAEQANLLKLLAENTTDDASLFYNHKVRYRDREVVHPFDIVRLQPDLWRVRQEIVWDRRNSMTQNARMFMPCDERIYWLTKGDFLFNDTSEVKAYSTVWEITPRSEISISAPFPIEIPIRAIQACSERGDLVLEPYGGSGTTLIACEQLGRPCAAVEINPAFCDVIIGRWEAFTGGIAELVDEFDPEEGI
jgi:DNA modification methylase